MEETTRAKESKMPTSKKACTRAFKLEATQLVKSCGKPMSQVARVLGISDSVLRASGVKLIRFRAYGLRSSG